MDLKDQMRQLAENARKASLELVRLTTEEKNTCLIAMAEAIDENESEIDEANRKDLDAGKANGLNSALLDRLDLNPKRRKSMSDGLRNLAELPDPTGKILDERTCPNDLKLRKVSVPIGVIVIIYESRPNVTADAAGLCFKSGNATILRGGKEAIHSNQAIARIMLKAAKKACPAFPSGAIQVVPTTDRKAIPELLSRGGEGLIRAVAECSKVPVIKHYKGICHTYVDGSADITMALAIAFNAKTHRPGVCNAMETLLIDRAIASEYLPEITDQLLSADVEVRVDQRGQEILKDQKSAIKKATEEDWTTEYLDRILSIRIVEDIEQAIDHINQYGSGHSDTIVTTSREKAERFMEGVDSAAVYWNASTRFTDGAEFGMGAEIGISTDKIGARGPMGLNELTSYKWLGYGTGQIRT